MSEQEQGPRAALGYLILAVRALTGGYRLPEMSWASRIYLGFFFQFYGLFALQFLTYTPGVGGGHLGVELIDAPPAHFIWGIILASVSLTQLAVLLLNHSALWRIGAVWTVSVAALLQGLFVIIATTLHSYSGLEWWLAILVVHALFVANHLVPIQKHVELSPQEKELFAELEARLQESSAHAEEQKRPAPSSSRRARPASTRSRS